MRESGRRANQYENAILNLMEAKLLEDRVGESFDAVVVEVDEKDGRRGEVSLVELAIESRVDSPRELPLGTRVAVRLSTADVATRRVGFTLD